MSKLQYHCPRYPQFNQPAGWLVDEPACHALFYYACLVARHLQDVKDDMVYEGELSPEAVGFNPRSVMLSIATVYGVEAERMVKFWSNVDLQFAMKGAQKIPARFRMDAVAEVNTSSN